MLGGEDADEVVVLPSGPVQLEEAGCHGDLRAGEPVEDLMRGYALLQLCSLF
jgi:hypothetical protein